MNLLYIWEKFKFLGSACLRSLYLYPRMSLVILLFEEILLHDNGRNTKTVDKRYTVKSTLFSCRTFSSSIFLDYLSVLRAVLLFIHFPVITLVDKLKDICLFTLENQVFTSETMWITVCRFIWKCIWIPLFRIHLVEWELRNYKYTNSRWMLRYEQKMLLTSFKSNSWFLNFLANNPLARFVQN